MKIDSFESINLKSYNFKDNTKSAILSGDKLVLGAGRYKIELTFEMDENNEADKLAIYLNESIYEIITLPIGLEKNIDISLTLDINMESEIRFVNESDDFLVLKHIIGGLYMSEPLQIINLSMFNPYSFDLELNLDFTDDIEVTVHKVGASITDLTLIPTQVVDKLNLANPAQSTEENPKLKTVIVSGTPPTLFEVGVSYKVEVNNSESLAAGLYSFDFTTFPMMNQNNCTVKAFGTRVIAVEFDYPVMNLDEYIVMPVGSTDDATRHIELNNFYISYYDKDLILDFTEGTWAGNIEIQKPYVYTPPVGAPTIFVINPFSAIVSPDHRRIEIQCNLGNFNTGALNKLAVNTNLSPAHDMARDLRDYSGRIIANFNKDFICEREAVAAEITPLGVRALSNSQVEVIFNKPVCVKRPIEVPLFPPAQFGVQYLDYFAFYNYFQINKVIDPNNKIALDVDTVNRTGNGFNSLIYTLDDADVSNLLPIPEVTIEVGKVMDASGLDTNPAVRTIVVPPTDPRFINVYQETPLPNPKNTKIRIVYNEKMTVGSGNNSAENPLNYLLEDPQGGLVNIPSGSIVAVLGSENKEFTLTIPSILPTGIYKLTALDPIKDFTGVNIETTTRAFQITDTVAPKVEWVIATTPDGTGKLGNTDNSMIIMYDKQMNVSNVEDHSVLRPINYEMDYFDGISYQNYMFNTTGNVTDIDDIYDDKWIRYTFPVDSMTDFIDKTGANPNITHIGYVLGQDVYFVRSRSGNIYPLCTTVQIDELVNKLNISTGVNTVEVTNGYQINYTLNSGVTSYINNLFGYVNASDFYVTIAPSTTKIYATGAVIDGYPFNKIILTFPVDTFDSSQTITLGVVVAPTSKDIFDKAIVGDVTVPVTNNIPTALKGIGLLDVDYATKNGTVEFLFEKSVDPYAVTDFNSDYINGGVRYSLAEVDPNLGVPVPSIATGRPNTVQLEVVLPAVSDVVLNNLYGSLSSSDTIPVVITDIYGKPIDRFTDVHVEILKVNSFSWRYNAPAAGVNESYDLILNFNKNISTGYITATGVGITPTFNNTSKVVTLNLTTGKLGNFTLQYIPTTPDISADINPWDYVAIVDPATPNVLTINIRPTIGQTTLFDTVAGFDVKNSRLKANYIPYPTGLGAGCAIVDEDDVVKVFAKTPNAAIV